MGAASTPAGSYPDVERPDVERPDGERFWNGRGERDPGSRGLGPAAVIVGAIGSLLLVGLALYFVVIGLALVT